MSNLTDMSIDLGKEIVTCDRCDKEIIETKPLSDLDTVEEAPGTKLEWMIQASQGATEGSIRDWIWLERQVLEIYQGSFCKNGHCYPTAT